MAQPWKVLESIPTIEGILELRQRGERDFLIMIGPQVLMNSLSNRSEIMLGQLGCQHVKGGSTPKVLVGGLGMGFTLRGVLDNLPVAAEVVVAELNPVVHGWCRGPLAAMTGHAIADPRVTVEIGDVSDHIARIAAGPAEGRYDAIILDLYRGPHAKTDAKSDPLYGSRAIEKMGNALKPNGVVVIWGEQYDEGFDRRLQNAGFTVTTPRPGKGGLRHVVFLGKRGKKSRIG